MKETSTKITCDATGEKIDPRTQHRFEVEVLHIWPPEPSADEAQPPNYSMSFDVASVDEIPRLIAKEIKDRKAQAKKEKS